jgi:hypothetical protein
MNCYLQRFTTGLAFVLFCFMVTALPAAAETGSDQDRWAFGGSAYLWAAGVEGTDSAGKENFVIRYLLYIINNRGH